MNRVKRRVDAAEGYLDLGMPGEALEELEPLGQHAHHRSEVLFVYMKAYRLMKAWDQLEVVTETLHERFPRNPCYVLLLAEAAWHGQRRARALRLLIEASTRMREEANLYFHLACYELKDGRVADALAHLTSAVALDPDYRDLALADEDLARLLAKS